MEVIDKTALITVQAYKNIAEDPIKRSTLIHDETSVQFLAYVLGDKNPHVVKLAVQTLQLLADSPKHCQKLASVFGVLEALQITADNPDIHGEELANQAAETFTALKFSRNASVNRHIKKSPVETERPQPQHVERVPSREGSVEALGFAALTLDAGKPSNGQRQFLKNNSKAKTITMKVSGMQTQEDRELLERRLVRIRGVISIVCDVSKERVTIRVRPDVQVDALGDAILGTMTMRPFLITRNDQNEEVLQALGRLAQENSAPNESLPAYLPDEEEEVSDKAMAQHGLKETASTWLSSAASFISKSFYW